MNTLLLDRDGVLNVELDYAYTPETMRLLPGVAEGLRQFKGWRLFVVSNQSAVGRGLTTSENVDACHAQLRKLLEAEDISVGYIVYCPHRPDEHCLCRKPNIGMWDQLAARYHLKPEDCAMVGNRDSDIAFARAIGCLSVRVADSRYPLAAPPDVYVTDLPELADVLLDTNDDHLFTVPEAAAFAQSMQKEGKRVVTTNGAFDLLHDGHTFLFAEARKHGDVLLVGVNSDTTVRHNKGEGRPVEKEVIRAKKVARYADGVFIFSDPDPRPWLTVIRPDVHVNASTYGEDCVEAAVLREIGSKLILVPVRPEFGSTTAILPAT